MNVKYAHAPVEAIVEGRRKDTLTAPADHPYGRYQAGDEVAPNDLCRAHVKAIAASRTPSGKISAEAQVAQAELARNKTNRQTKAQVKALLREAGLV